MLASNVALPLPPPRVKANRQRPTRRGTDRQRKENVVIGHIHNQLPEIDELKKGKRVFPPNNAAQLAMMHPDKPSRDCVDDDSSSADMNRNRLLNLSQRYHLRPMGNTIFPQTGNWTERRQGPDLHVTPRKDSNTIVHRRCKYDSISTLLDMGFTPDESHLTRGPQARLLKNYPCLVGGKPW